MDAAATNGNPGDASTAEPPPPQVDVDRGSTKAHCLNSTDVDSTNAANRGGDENEVPSAEAMNGNALKITNGDMHDNELLARENTLNLQNTMNGRRDSDVGMDSNATSTEDCDNGNLQNSVNNSNGISNGQDIQDSPVREISEADVTDNDNANNAGVDTEEKLRCYEEELNNQFAVSVPYTAEDSEVTDPSLARADTIPVESSLEKTSPGELKLDIEEDNKAVFYIGEEQNLATSPKSPRTFFGSFASNQRILSNGHERRRSSLVPAIITRMSEDRKKKKKEKKKLDKDGPHPEFVPPDGGYGWVVVFAACIVNMWIVGFIKSYSVLYVQIIAEFPGSSAYHASWIPALLSTIGLLVAPVIGVMCRKFTSRKVSAFGGLLCFLGLFCSAFATSLTQLIFTIGVITGLGAGFTQTPGILIVSLYFSKRRSMASAICVSGNAIGSFFMPPLIDFLVSQYRLRGTFLIVAALQLHIVAASLLYRPIRDHARVQARERALLEESNKKLLHGGDSVLDTGFDFEAESKFSRNKSGSVFNRVISGKLLSNSGEETEMTRRVSFLRSTSMMSSVPDLGEYAKSWQVSSKEIVAVIPTDDVNQLIQQRRRSSRKHTVSESADFKPLQNFSDLPDGGDLPKNNSAILPAVVGNKPASIRRVNSSQPRMTLARQVSVRRQGNLSSLPEKVLDSSVSLVPSEPPIREEDESPVTSDHPIPEEESPVKFIHGTLELESKDGSQHDDDCDKHSDAHSVQETKERRFSGLYKAMATMFDKELLKTRKMILMSISVALVAVGAPHSLFYLHAYAKSVDVDPSFVTKLLSISSMVDLVGRLGVGFLADLNILDTAYLYFFSAGLAGLSAFSLTWTRSFTGMAILLGTYGLGIGSWFVLIPTMLATNHGINKLAASFGFVRFCMGLINFVSPQISGALVDITGGYAAIYYFMGSCMMLAAVLVLVEKLVSKTEENKLMLVNA